MRLPIKILFKILSKCEISHHKSPISHEKSHHNLICPIKILSRFQTSHQPSDMSYQKPPASLWLTSTTMVDKHIFHRGWNCETTHQRSYEISHPNLHQNRPTGWRRSTKPGVVPWSLLRGSPTPIALRCEMVAWMVNHWLMVRRPGVWGIPLYPF